MTSSRAVAEGIVKPKRATTPGDVIDFNLSFNSYGSSREGIVATFSRGGGFPVGRGLFDMVRTVIVAVRGCG